MKPRPLGSTGQTVTPLGLGLAALGRPGYINLGHADDLGRDYDLHAMEQHAHRVLDRAWDAGIRYFDAARSYGQAERFLASWLASRSLDHRSVLVGSKWGYTYTANWQVQAKHHEVKEHSLAVLQRQQAESHNLLGPFLKLYQIHSATLESGVLDNREVLDELARLRDQGLLIGLSLTGPRQADTLRRALAIEIGGRRLFACVQATWNLLETSVGPALAEARAAGVGVLIKEALANGRLTSRNREPTFTPKRQRLEEQAQRLGTTLDALALAAVLAQPWSDVVLSGAATIGQLESNLGALDVAWDAQAAEALKDLAEPAEVYWTERGQLAWN